MNKHFPCGHWHKRPSKVAPTPVPISMWQQSLDLIKDSNYMAVGAPSLDMTKLLVTGVDYSLDTLLSSATGTFTFTSNAPGPVIACSINGKKASLYANYTFDADGNATLSFIGVNEYQTTWTSTIDASLLDGSYRLSENYILNCMCLLPNGKLVIVYRAVDLSDNYIYTKVSDDYGVTWSDRYQVAVDRRQLINLCCDTSGVLYCTNTASGAAFTVYKSVDSGEHWSKLLTIPAGTAQSNVISCVSGTRLYILQDVNYVNVLYYSDDGGATWTSNSMTTSLAHEAVTAIAANGSNIVAHTYVGYDTYLYQSVDAGANWTNLGKIGSGTGTWPTLVTGYSVGPILTNDDEVFVCTSCHAYVADTPYLGYLLSTDNGANWVVKQLPILQ